METLIPYEEALARWLDALAPLAAETVSLAQAGGRVLATDLVASHDQPPEPRSIMDGIAVAGGEPSPGTQFALVGSSYAGAPYDRPLGAGEAVRIATGAVVPDGAERVLPQEWLDFRDDVVAIERCETAAPFIRPAATDFAHGETLLTAGTRLHPAALALVAAANAGSVAVHRRPRIGVATSGDELIEPGSPMERGRTIDSGSTLVSGLASDAGASVARLANLPDTHQAVREALERVRPDLDILVVIGGASVGDRDHLRPVVRELGGTMLFERIAMRPGKPTWAARLPDGLLLLGLPGNPGSAFVAALLFLLPAIRMMSGEGCDASSDRPARFVGDDPIRNGPREAFLPAVAAIAGEGLAVHPAGPPDSGLQRALACANCLLRLPPDTIVEQGGSCSIILFGSTDRL
ncbi:molybdopterin molybdotransferase MoeA [Sphingomicrobium sp. XHP0239]|uniref:molybdopterin molybdotransferase MoeA n=1 Tax=Sphingomicrobium maritimum TaxID=3133972 RepID=UPI0031CC9115